MYGEVAARRDERLLSDLAVARADLADERHVARTVRADAQGSRDELAEAEADAAAAEQQRLLDGVTGGLEVLVREEQARREASAAAAAPAAGKWNGPVPDPRGGAGAAVTFAQAQLGKPYEYAASGPDTYAGLTLRAWQAGGLSLPHHSGAQGSMFPRVPLDQLQPGDLITTNSWPAPVGIWVGGGSSTRHTLVT